MESKTKDIRRSKDKNDKNKINKMKAEGKHPAPITEMSPGGAFGRAGASDWDPRREIYREAPQQAAE